MQNCNNKCKTNAKPFSSNFPQPVSFSSHHFCKGLFVFAFLIFQNVLSFEASDSKIACIALCNHCRPTSFADYCFLLVVWLLKPESCPHNGSRASHQPASSLLLFTTNTQYKEMHKSITYIYLHLTLIRNHYASLLVSRQAHTSCHRHPRWTELNTLQLRGLFRELINGSDSGKQ